MGLCPRLAPCGSAIFCTARSTTASCQRSATKSREKFPRCLAYVRAFVITRSLRFSICYSGRLSSAVCRPGCTSTRSPHALTVRFLFLGERTLGQARGPATLTRLKQSRVQELIECRLGAALTLQELAVAVGYS